MNEIAGDNDIPWGNVRLIACPSLKVKAVEVQRRPRPIRHIVVIHNDPRRIVARLGKDAGDSMLGATAVGMMLAVGIPARASNAQAGNAYIGADELNKSSEPHRGDRDNTAVDGKTELRAERHAAPVTPERH